MGRFLFFVAGAVLVALTGHLTSVAAQPAEYRQRAEDLATLSRIFGELHHIRRTCNPADEADVWRNRMRTLIELEDPQEDLRATMVNAFNAGYRNAETRYPYCDRDARNYAAAIAAQGDGVTARLMAPLYGALAETGDLPEVWRGGEQ